MRRRKEEVEASIAKLRQRIEDVQSTLAERINRKQELAEQIQSKTVLFREEASELALEVSRVQDRLKEVFARKEVLED